MLWILGFLVLGIIFQGYRLGLKILRPPCYSLSRVKENPELRKRWELDHRETPEEFGRPFQEIRFTSLRPGNPVLSGWFLPGKSDRAVILVHGRLSNRLKNLRYLEFLKDLDDSLLLFDQAGSGDSEKGNSTMGYEESLDLLSACEFLKAHFEIRRFSFFAFSMGCAASVLAAQKMEGVDRLILDSPFSSAREIIRQTASRRGYPGFLTQYALFWFSILGKVPLKKLDLTRKLASLNLPILILHSERDEAVPAEHSRKLFETGGSLCRIQWFPQGEHVRLYYAQPEIYRDSVMNFLQAPQLA